MSGPTAAPSAGGTTTGESSRPSRATPAETARPTGGRESMPSPKVGDFEVLFSGIRRPHGIGVVGDTVFVSSEVDRGLFRIEDGAPEFFAPLNFPHDMIALPDGSLITPVFLEDRLVRIGPDAAVTELARGLAGPNGLTAGAAGGYIVSNYRQGTVVLIERDAALPRTLAARLKGPAGVAYDGRTLYVAEYLSNRVAVIEGERRSEITPIGLTRIESLSIDAGNRLLATAERNGRGVVAAVQPDGRYDVLVTTELPAPLVGHFRGDGYVFLVSPNDPEGRVLRTFVGP